MRVELSQKAVHFILIALETQQEVWRARQDDPATSEDDHADLGNDIALLESIRADLRAAAG